jgi:hypothetical protein
MRGMVRERKQRSRRSHIGALCKPSVRRLRSFEGLRFLTTPNLAAPARWVVLEAATLLECKTLILRLQRLMSI